MRIPSMRAMVILACVALVVVALACQAGAMFLNLLPDNPFIGSRTQVDNPFGSSGHTFFSTAMGAMPGSDPNTTQQINTILDMKMNMRPAYTSSGDSWMSGMATFGTKPVDLSNSTIDTGYGNLIKRFDNQSNIFEY